MFGMILRKVGDLLLPKAGKILQGKLTNIGLGVTAAGMAYAGIEGGNVFESLRVLVDIAERGYALLVEAKPQLVILFGGVTALIGWFRRAGRRHAEDEAA